MTETRLIGHSATHDRQLYVAQLASVGDWPLALSEVDKPFVLFTALDASTVSDEQLLDFARKLLDQGCLYTCSWGQEARRVEDAFDEVAIEADLAGRPYTKTVVMTTSHEAESLDDALWFAVFTASPADVDARAVLAVSEEEWATEIESKFADPARWSAGVLRAEEDADA